MTKRATATALVTFALSMALGYGGYKLMNPARKGGTVDDLTIRPGESFDDMLKRLEREKGIVLVAVDLSAKRAAVESTEEQKNQLRAWEEEIGRASPTVESEQPKPSGE